MLLAPGLGKNSKTTMVICAAPENEHSSETVNAIKFGQICRRIKQEVVRDKFRMMKDIMDQIELDIQKCEETIRKKERWEIVENTRIDSYGDLEIKKITNLIGAEEERARLEELLRRKAELTGVI